MPMIALDLRAKVINYLKETAVLIYEVSEDGVVSSRYIPVLPSDKFLDAICEIVPFIHSNAQISGNLNYTGSGGLIAGAGGAIPGPVTGSLTGVPITGLGTMPIGSIQ